jgi:hypothetical protein
MYRTYLERFGSVDEAADKLLINDRRSCKARESGNTGIFVRKTSILWMLVPITFILDNALDSGKRG